ncbi:2-amino-4-hydroxy-6-hydroxymethyldihydropteridine diphosphokinase [Novosphingobium soli]|uniref:2-amino-4-hydroxy-6-hydroxymethyldihydropteridine pyrophosphokinase n=1 Tax=Novosphingobium soli TaxID=574956 RepID=A0ABV6CUL4_9SPHN
MDAHRYLVALGSNMRHPRYGTPRRVLAAAVAAMAEEEFSVLALSPMIESAPLGPSHRRYANAVAAVSSRLKPDDALERLHQVEHSFGRCRRGQAWGARVLDLDIVLWSGGAHVARADRAELVIPHAAFRHRRFVLDPAAALGGDWRDPLTHLTLRQLRARLTKPRSTLR